jgi:hypothetical protein
MTKAISIHAMDSIQTMKNFGKTRIAKPIVSNPGGLVYWGIVRPVTREETIFFGKPSGRRKDFSGRTNKYCWKATNKTFRIHQETIFQHVT